VTKKTVLLVCPSRQGIWRLEMSELIKTFVYLNSIEQYGFYLDFDVVVRVEGTAHAFNHCCKIAVDRGFDYVWIWDHDQSPTLAAFYVLDTVLKHDPAIVQASLPNLMEIKPGLYGPAYMGGFREPTGDKFTMRTWHISNEPYEVDACGTGGMLIRTDILKDPRMLVAEGYDPPAWFQEQRQPNGCQTVGTDLDFSYRAKQNGYKVMMDPRAVTDHFRDQISMNHMLKYGEMAYNKGRADAAEELENAKSKEQVSSEVLRGNSGGQVQEEGAQQSRSKGASEGCEVQGAPREEREDELSKAPAVCVWTCSMCGNVYAHIACPNCGALNLEFPGMVNEESSK